MTMGFSGFPQSPSVPHWLANACWIARRRPYWRKAILISLHWSYYVTAITMYQSTSDSQRLLTTCMSKQGTFRHLTARSYQLSFGTLLH